MRARVIMVLVVAPLLVAGLAGTVVALAGRGAEEAFVHAQRTAQRLETTDVERVVRTAGEPVRGPHPPGIRARCRSLGSGDLRNPWRCTVTYRSGRRARYEVQLKADGSYVGRHIDGTGVATGCCVALPGAD